jgi:hypothetical protein
MAYLVTRVVLAVALLASVYGQSEVNHDHTKHMDLELIKKETLRLARSSEQSVKNSMQHLERSVKKIAEKYTALRESHREQTWADNYQESYRKAYDYLVMTSLICKSRFKEDFCSIHDDLWNGKLDGRSVDFIHTFYKEAKKAVKDATSKLDL